MTSLKNKMSSAYMNRDQADHRERLLSGEMPFNEKITLLNKGALLISTGQPLI